MKLHTIAVATLALAGFATIGQSHAGQVLTNAGGVSVGIQDMGALGYSNVGISLSGLGDAITPGCLCEGWGASANGISGWSANDNGGDSNVALGSFSSTASSATSIVSIGGAGLNVTQTYTSSASNALFVNHVTLTNTTGSTISNVRYSRSMDWDIPPTTFAELVTIGGVGASRLLFSNDNGFAIPDPLTNPSSIAAGTINVNFADSGPNDHGAFFTFGFGDLGANDSVSFDIFYGAADSEASAMAALGTVGAEVYSLGQNSDLAGMTTGAPGTYIFGFAGVGGTPVSAVPEPESYALLLAGLGLVAAVARRQKSKKV